MKLAELLDLHRARYIDHFVGSLAKWSGGWSEILLEMGNYIPDPIYKLIRGDYVRQIKGEIKLTEFRLNEPLDHAPFTEVRGDFVVEVRPFLWHQCWVLVHCERLDRQALEAWIMHWLDTEDTKDRDADDLKQCIHYVTPPTYPLGKLAFSVDFGTAPVKAVLELIQLLQMEKGTTRVVLGAEL